MPAQIEATLSKKEDFWIRTASILLILVVATAAGLLSWNGLTYLAAQSGIPHGFAWMLALAVDGMILLSTAEILHSSLTGRSTVFGWLLSAFGISLSIWGNIASADSLGIQSQAVHAISPVSLFLSVEAFSRIIKHRITVTAEQQREQLLEQQREQARELKRQQALTKKTASTVSTSVDAALSTVNKPAPKQGSGRGSRVSADDAEVGIYKQIVDALPSDSTKAGKIEAILIPHPEARNAHIALALDCDIKAVATTIVRIRAKVQAAGSETGSQADKFQEIVKDFSSVAVTE